MVLSLLLPLLKVEYFTIETDSRILLLLNQFNQNSAQEVENSFNFWDFGALILGIVSFFLLAKLTLGLVKIHQLKKEIKEYIHYYNHQRIKSNLNGKSPVQYRALSLNLNHS